MTVEGAWNPGQELPPRSDCPAYALEAVRYCVQDLGLLFTRRQPSASCTLEYTRTSFSRVSSAHLNLSLEKRRGRKEEERKKGKDGKGRKKKGGRPERGMQGTREVKIRERPEG